LGDLFGIWDLELGINLLFGAWSASWRMEFFETCFSGKK